jgi:ferrous iron transport protein B
MPNQFNRICLVGNPNTGKSSLFNHLTGLKQHIGNFPGVTVEKKTGTFVLSSGKSCELIDLPGTYSIVPQTADEQVVFDLLQNAQQKEEIHHLIYVADATNLQRNLLFFSQLYDLKWPMVFVITLTDLMGSSEIESILNKFKHRFPDVPILAINARTGEGIEALEAMLEQTPEVGQRETFGLIKIEDLLHNNVLQRRDAAYRYKQIDQFLGKHQLSTNASQSFNWDRLLVHPIFGYGLLLVLLLLIFQVVFHLAAYPMDLIDGAFASCSTWIQTHMPEGHFTNLIANGVVPGIGGVFVFVPQIAFLFFFLALLEESGYMARIVFITDRLVRPFGLSGRSVVPLISSAACAIPGVMAARSIPNYKDRMITIFVAPLMSCSARIPVYTLLIALIIPDISWGPFNVQGLILFFLYSLGLITALVVAVILKWIIRSKETSFLLMEMPKYQWPRWSQVSLSIWIKVKVFLLDAGKIILAISILLWGLASFGPNDRIERAVAKAQMESLHLTESEKMNLEATVRLENSYIGILGKGIEPIIQPLGYDWKIGISLITSFAAREVFVGSLATIYSVGDSEEDSKTLIEKMRSEVNEKGEPRFSLATGLSLMIFYAYAMQCMATLAVVKRETNSWKWPIIQLLSMGALAYLAALFTFNLLS